MRKQIVALEDDADVLAQGPEIDVRKVDPVSADDDFAMVDLFEAVDAAQGRALARAGATDDSENFAAFDGEADAVEHLERAKALLHVAERHDRRWWERRFAACQAGARLTLPRPMRRSSFWLSSDRG